MYYHDDDSKYFECISKVERWCDTNHLCLNINKTKEMLWDFRENPSQKTTVKLKNMDVEAVQSYKYLGLYIDSGFSFAHHIKTTCKKVNKRMYFVRSMVKLNVDPNIIALFFNSTIPPVLNYSMLTFYKMIPQYARYELDKPRKICQRLIGKSYDLIDNLKEYNRRAKHQADKVIKDSAHPLHKEYVKLPSGRRYRVVKARTERYRLSYVPVSIRLLNS